MFECQIPKHIVLTPARSVTRFDINTDPMKSSVERAWDYMDRIGLLNAASKKIDIDEHINTELFKEALDTCQSKYGNDDPAFYEKMQSQYSAYDQ